MGYKLLSLILMHHIQFMGIQSCLLLLVLEDICLDWPTCSFFHTLMGVLPVILIVWWKYSTFCWLFNLFKDWIRVKFKRKFHSSHNKNGALKSLKCLPAACKLYPQPDLQLNLDFATYQSYRIIKITHRDKQVIDIEFRFYAERWI